MILALEFADRLYANSGGFYVDVGAFHPEHYSTTQYFYLQGWRGINIDAMPERMKLFQQLRPEDTNLEMGVSQVRSKLTYHLFDYPNMSTCCEETAHRFLEQGRTIITQQEVETYPLAEILEKYLPKNQSIDFLNIDVEGLDYQVLNSNDWNQYRPHIVLVEDLDCLPIEQICDSRILQFMKEQGYELMAKTLFTLIFKNKYLN
jgi:FkbM family methyltransferase